MNDKRSYSELCKIQSYEERFNYLKMDGVVGEPTFGSERYLNQQFYTSEEWRTVRDKIIIRDNGCDMGCTDHTIFGRIIVHHINPITSYDLINHTKKLTDPENLICVCHQTHEGIHYGDINLLQPEIVERHRNDTCPWRK